MNEIAFVYDEKFNPRGAFIAGVPNADLTLEKFESFDPRKQSKIISVAFFRPVAAVPAEFEDELETAVRSANEIDATDGAIELAEEFGIDLLLVNGSGTDGRILKNDVGAMIADIL